jgi:hypothetical protein
MEFDRNIKYNNEERKRKVKEIEISIPMTVARGFLHFAKQKNYIFYETAFTYPTTTEKNITVDSDGTKHITTSTIIKPAILGKAKEPIDLKPKDFSMSLLVQNDNSAYYFECDKRVVDDYDGTSVNYIIGITAVPRLENSDHEEEWNKIVSGRVRIAYGNRMVEQKDENLSTLALFIGGYSNNITAMLNGDDSLLEEYYSYLTGTAN